MYSELNRKKTPIVNRDLVGVFFQCDDVFLWCLLSGLYAYCGIHVPVIPPSLVVCTVYINNTPYTIVFPWYSRALSFQFNTNLRLRNFIFIFIILNILT